jgi:hypothetical protein
MAKWHSEGLPQICSYKKDLLSPARISAVRRVSDSTQIDPTDAESSGTYQTRVIDSSVIPSCTADFEEQPSTEGNAVC